MKPFLLSRDEIESAFDRLGELAVAGGESLEIVVLGGTAMVLGFQARTSTKDVDYAPLDVGHPAKLRMWAAQVAAERGWDPSWLNDGAKGFLHGHSTLTRVYNPPGMQVYIPSIPQLLAMKLAAWRDDVDICDAS